MTRRLTRLADIAYRRRGRVVLVWIVAMFVIIGVGSSLAGEFSADYDTPGSESKAASDITEQRFAGYSGQEIFVVWKDPAGANSPQARQRINAFLAEAEKVNNVSPHTPIRVSDNGEIAATTLPMTVPGWDFKDDDARKIVDAAEANDGGGLQIELGGDPIYSVQSQSSPEGFGFLGAAIVLLIAFGSVVAAGLPLGIALVGLGISSAGLIPLLVQRDRRARLDHRRLRPDRDRRRDRLRAARPHPIPLGDAGGQGSPRRRGRGRHDRGPQRDHRRLYGGDRGPRADADRAELHVRSRNRHLPGGAHRDVRLDHAAARLPLVSRPEGRQAPHSTARPLAEEGGRGRAAAGARRRIPGRAVEPCRAAAAVAVRDRSADCPAGAGGAGAGHASRLPGRGQRPARHDDPSGLRPEHRGIRAGHQRPDPDRGDDADEPAGEVRDRRLREHSAEHARRGVRRPAADQPGG